VRAAALGRWISLAIVWTAFTAASMSSTTCAAAAQAAPDMSSFIVVVARTADAPPIDGSIDHPVWRGAAHVALTWNVDFRRPADEPTDALVLTDGEYLYVAFVAHQKATPLVTQRTNGPAVND